MLNESKYRIEGDSLVNKKTGIPIPDEEPVFVFRAKDKRALFDLAAGTVISAACTMAGKVD